MVRLLSLSTLLLGSGKFDLAGDQSVLSPVQWIQENVNERSVIKKNYIQKSIRKPRHGRPVKAWAFRMIEKMSNDTDC